MRLQFGQVLIAGRAVDVPRFAQRVVTAKVNPLSIFLNADTIFLAAWVATNGAICSLLNCMGPARYAPVYILFCCVNLAFVFAARNSQYGCVVRQQWPPAPFRRHPLNGVSVHFLASQRDSYFLARLWRALAACYCRAAIASISKIVARRGLGLKFCDVAPLKIAGLRPVSSLANRFLQKRASAVPAYCLVQQRIVSAVLGILNVSQPAAAQRLARQPDVDLAAHGVRNFVDDPARFFYKNISHAVAPLERGVVRSASPVTAGWRFASQLYANEGTTSK